MTVLKIEKKTKKDNSKDSKFYAEDTNKLKTIGQCNSMTVLKIEKDSMNN